jgi:glycine cleavage system H protein
MNFPDNLLYTKEHEWIKVDGNIATIGITAFAQSELGDIIFVDVNTVGDIVTKDSVFGSIEAVKTVSDLFMPVSGKILELNGELSSDAALINTDPYGKGWIIKAEISDPSELVSLMSADAYKAEYGL